jgi:polysaccharide biosynthesis/export protein
MTRRRIYLAAFITLEIWTSVPFAQGQGSVEPKDPTAAAAATGSDEPLRWFQGGRYRLTPTDVVELTFPYVPEFNQVLTVQPDGYVTLKAAGELRVQGLTLPEIRVLLIEKYSPVLRDPVVTLSLKEFEKPYFVAAGEVNKPGKFELRGATSLTQALAIAGGLTPAGKSSEVVLFRRFSVDTVEVKKIDVKKIFNTEHPGEDPLLRPGDTLVVPKTTLGKIQRFIPLAQLGLYFIPYRVW